MNLYAFRSRLYNGFMVSERISSDKWLNHYVRNFDRDYRVPFLPIIFRWHFRGDCETTWKDIKRGYYAK